MLNLKVESYKDYLTQDGHVVIAEKMLEKQFGKQNLKWILSQNFLKQLEKSDVNHLVLSFPYGEDGELEEFFVFWEAGKYVFEPVADHLEIWKSGSLPEKVFKITTNDFVRLIALANGYSHCSANFHLQDGFYFVGSRKMGNKDVGLLLLNGNPRLDFKKIEEQVKLAQQFNSSTSYIVLAFENQSLPEVASDLGFSLSKMRSNLLVSPQSYKDIGIGNSNVVGAIKYPVLIDHERELLFFLGKQVTKQSGTTLYKYLRDFLLHTQHSSMAYALFCSQYCLGQNGEASRVIGERKKEAIQILKAEFGEGSEEYNFLTNGFFGYERGFLKSHFSSDDIFEWPS